MGLNHLDFALQAFDIWLETHKFSKNSKVLDVGCRDTCLQGALEERGFVWTGIDKYPQATSIIKGSMESMPLRSCEYDLVFACHSFEHCERPVDALREFMRVLKPGGWLFLATPMPCHHHILGADPDHIFVLNTYQMVRLLIYTEYEPEAIASWLHPGDIEQNNTICSVGRKP